MDTCRHDLPTLFAQLGLPSDAASINNFIASHELPPGTSLPKASFWNPAQASFLKEALADDADWAEAVDEIAMLLSSRPAPHGGQHAASAFGESSVFGQFFR